MRRTQAGMSITELLVSLLMTLVISGALFTAFVNTFQARDTVVGQGTVESAARTPIDDLADHLRNAQQYWTTGSTTPTAVTQSMVIAAGTTTSVTYYKSNSSTDTVRYWLSGSNLQRTADGTTTTVLANVQSLLITYYKDAGGNYNVDYNSLTKTGSTLTSADLPLISEVNIYAKVVIDGFKRDLACRVRLRNSPYKLHL